MQKIYKAEYEDDGFEIFGADNDESALDAADSYEDEDGMLLEIFEINEDFEEIRKVF